MEFPLIILTLPFLFTLLLSQAESADLTDFAPVVFGSSKKDLMKCFQCNNITHEGCSEIPRNSTTFSSECEEGAKACVKRLYDIDGYTVMSRECSYAPMKVFHDFSCTGTRTHFPREKCYMCNSNLCNSSTRFYGSSNIVFTWILTTFGLMIVPAVLSLQWF